MRKKKKIKINSDSDNVATDPKVDTLETEQAGPLANDEVEADTAGSSNAEPDELTELKNKVTELEDKLLRAQAEYENSRRRSMRLLEDRVRFAAERPLSGLLDVVDNFERAFEHAEEDDNQESFKQGMEMIRKQLVDLLAKFGVKPIVAVGEPFDPQLHEALLQVESDDHDAGVIVQEINRGYLVEDRVLRHSKVGVAKEKQQDAS